MSLPFRFACSIALRAIEGETFVLLWRGKDGNFDLFAQYFELFYSGGAIDITGNHKWVAPLLFVVVG